MGKKKYEATLHEELLEDGSQWVLSYAGGLCNVVLFAKDKESAQREARKFLKLAKQVSRIVVIEDPTKALELEDTDEAADDDGSAGSVSTGMLDGAEVLGDGCAMDGESGVGTRGGCECSVHGGRHPGTSDWQRNTNEPGIESEVHPEVVTS